MDNRQELLKKLQILVQEIDKAKNGVDDKKIKYLNNYKSQHGRFSGGIYD